MNVRTNKFGTPNNIFMGYVNKMILEKYEMAIDEYDGYKIRFFHILNENGFFAVVSNASGSIEYNIELGAQYVGKSIFFTLVCFKTHNNCTETTCIYTNAKEAAEGLYNVVSYAAENIWFEEN